MRPSCSLVILLLLLGPRPGGAQTSAPGVCFAFNDPTGSVAQSQLPLVGGGDLYLAFTAPVSALIDRVDVGTAAFSSAALSLEVYQQTTVGTLGAFIGAASAPSTPGAAAFAFAPAISFAAGANYVLHLTTPLVSPATLPTLVAGLANPLQPLQYLFSCGPSPAVLFPPCASYAPTGTFGATLRFRSLACGPTPLASASIIGTSCGGAPPYPAVSVSGPPVIGSTIVVNVVASSGMNLLFWASGPATSGLSLGAGGCVLYLDPTSLQALAAAGLEPLVAVPTSGFPTQVPIAIPHVPNLAGTTVTGQVAIVGTASGAVILGYTVQLTAAVQLTLGY